MGDFFDSIEKELDALDEAAVTLGGDWVAVPAHAAFGFEFGADYNTNSTVVRQVQSAINALGYQPPLSVDGAFGPLTSAGIRWLQTAKGLTPDGIIGDQTLGSLGITPPAGVSVEFAKGAAKGAAAAALAALQQEFSPLIAWSASNPQPISKGKGVAPGFQATKSSVVNSYVDWTTPLEGFVPHMYIDALGYVTTGMGNLIDPVSTALALPWKRADGSRAGQQEIIDAWNTVDGLRSDPKGQKQTSGPATQGGGSQGQYTTLRVSKADVQQLVANKMRENEGYILSGLPSFASAPAPAQLAVHSMSWAMGPRFAQTWTQFRDAFSRGDYRTAADQSHMQGVGIDMRNMANKLLLTNAAQVVAGKKSPDTLFYINDLASLYSSSRWPLIFGIAAALGVATGGAIFLSRNKHAA